MVSMFAGSGARTGKKGNASSVDIEGSRLSSRGLAGIKEFGQEEKRSKIRDWETRWLLLGGIVVKMTLNNRMDLWRT